MAVLSASRETTCTGCGAVLRAGRRGPLPRRCPGCRRRPVLPERTAGSTACRECGRSVRVRGHRGCWPGRCGDCARARVRARRAPVIVPMENLTPADWAALDPGEGEAAARATVNSCVRLDPAGQAAGAPPPGSPRQSEPEAATLGGPGYPWGSREARGPAVLRVAGAPRAPL